MRRGFYFIGTYQHDRDGKQFYGPHLEEGSIEEYGRLFIHRKIEHAWCRTGWRLSHTNSGAAIVADVDLKSARLLAKKLQPFKLWDIKTYEEISEACKDMDNPEVVKIMELRHLRA